MGDACRRGFALLGGVQLIGIGILGEYLGRTLGEVRSARLYLRERSLDGARETVTMKTKIGDLPIVLLCGGRGTRLRPATDDIPKALVPVNGQPIIDYIVKFFAHSAGLVYLPWLPWRSGSVPPRRPAGRDQRALADSGEEAGILKIHTLRAPSYPTGSSLCLLRHFHRYRPRSAKRLSHGTTLRDTSDAPIQSPFGVVRRDEVGMASSFIEKPVQDYFIGYFMMERQLLESFAVGVGCPARWLGHC